MGWEREAATQDAERRIVRYEPLVLVVAAFASGIVLDRFCGASFALWLVVSFAALVGWWRAWCLQQCRTASLILLLAVAAAGGAWHHVYWNRFAADDLGLAIRHDSRPVCVDVFVLSAPRWIPAPRPSPMSSIPQTDLTEITVQLLAVRSGQKWQTASGESVLRIKGKLPNVATGDQLRVFARAFAPSPPLNPGENDFAAYERGLRRLCRLNCDGADYVTKLPTNSRWTWRALVSWLRESGRLMLSEYVTPDDSPLAAAVLLGTRERLDQATTDGFFLTGIVHLLAISGMNVGILAFGFWWLTRLSPLPRWATLLIVAGLVSLYALVTDAQPPVVRATILILCLCCARWLGRRAFAFNTLAFAGLIVLILNPTNLFQVGAQLSFLAVAALSCWNPLAEAIQESHDPLTQLIERSRPAWIRFAKVAWSWIWRGFLSSAFVWVITVPLVWYRFQIISPVALLLNPIVMLPIAVAMYSGFGVLLLGRLLPWVARVCGWLCGYSLAAIQASIGVSLVLRGNHLWLPPPALWWVILFYAVLALALAFPAWLPPAKWRPWLLSGLFVIGLGSSQADFLPRWRTAQPELTCTFIAVGHGTSVLLELPNGKKMLYDAGRVGAPEIAVRPIAATLWSSGITKLDAIVVSHADTDHYNAVPELLKRFSVARVFVSPAMFREPSPGTNELRRGIEKSQVAVELLQASDTLSLDENVAIKVLHPPAEGVPGTDNANSIVLLIEWQGRQILLPGDLEAVGLDRLLQQEPIDSDIVMVPHHGSKRSNPVGFARWCSPEWVAISGSRGKDSAFVREAYQAAGGRVFHTGEVGAVRFRVTPGEIAVETFRPH